MAVLPIVYIIMITSTESIVKQKMIVVERMPLHVLSEKIPIAITTTIPILIVMIAEELTYVTPINQMMLPISPHGYIIQQEVVKW
jgi:hypothetical protein